MRAHTCFMGYLGGGGREGRYSGIEVMGGVKGDIN